jgi:hypothetical protein
MVNPQKMLWLKSYRQPFTWSHSRDQLFQLCKRRYYWRYYAPYGGNTPGEEGDRVLLYLLGRLTNISALIGTTVHAIARDALRAARDERPWDVGIYVVTAEMLLRRALSRSLKGCHQPTEKVQRQTVLLWEHYYHQPLDEIRTYATVKHYTETLRSHPTFQHALAEAQHLVLVDEVRRFDVDGVSVFSVPDVLISLPDGSFQIIDWKTGSAVVENLEVARTQLVLYALYLYLENGIAPEAISCEVVDLNNGTTYQWQVTTGQLAEARDRVTSSIAAMHKCLQDVNANKAARDDYPQTDSADSESFPCTCCAYRSMCFS